LAEESLARELSEAISSAEAVPGAGWVAAACSGFAAALVAKSAGRSEGWSDSEGARAQALELRARLLALAAQDAKAYDTALAALERRDSSLGRALAKAAQVPLQIAECSADAALLAAEVAERAEGSARADASAAASLAAGSARAAARLVEVNLGAVTGDERVARAHRAVEAADDAAKRALAAEP